METGFPQDKVHPFQQTGLMRQSHSLYPETKTVDQKEGRAGSMPSASVIKMDQVDQGDEVLG